MFFITALIAPFFLSAATFKSIPLSSENYNKRVWEISDSKSGHIWLSTEDGIYIYDGKVSKKLVFNFKGKKQNLLGFRTVEHVGPREIWLGTNSLGLWRVKYQYSNHGIVGSAESILDTKTQIKKIRRIGRNVFVGVGPVLHIYDLGGELDSKLDFEGFIGSGVTGRLYDIIEYQDRILIATAAGIFELSQRKRKWYISSKYLKSIRINSFFQYQDNVVVSTNNGLYLGSNDGEGKEFEILDVGIKKIQSSVVIDGDYIFGALAKGLFKFTENGLEKYSNNILDKRSFAGESVISIFKSFDGNIWIGTWENGLQFLKRTSFHFNRNYLVGKEGDCIKSKQISAFTPLSIGYYVVVIGEKVLLTNLSNSCFAVPLPEENTSVFDVSVVDQNSFFLSTRQGTFLYNIDKNKFYWKMVSKIPARFITNLNNEAYCLVGIGEAHIIDLKKLEEKSVFVDQKQYPFNRITSCVNFNDNWLFTTNQGVWKYKKGRLEKIVTGDSAIDNGFILASLVSRQNILWVGVADKGVVAIDNTEIRYVTRDNYAISLVLGLTEDDNGSIWAASSSGLLKVDKKYQPTLFKSVDGVQSNKTLRDIYYFNHKVISAGPEGINEFSPNFVSENKIMPITKILSIFQNGEYLGYRMQGSYSNPTRNSFSLPTNSNTVEFIFSGVHYENPGENLLQYKLEGFDKDWRTESSATANAIYTNLSWGDYTFRVRSRSSTGVWDYEGDSVQIRILTPYWARWWAFVLYGLALLGLIMLYGRWRSRVVEQRAEHLEGEVQKRTEELAVQNQQIASQ